VVDENIKWFRELTNEDVAIAGGKGASLGEMYNNKLPIPPGFVVTAQAFKKYIEKSGIKNKIMEKLSKVDINNTQELQAISLEIQDLILETEMLDDIKKEIIEAYDNLNVDSELHGVSKNALSIIKAGRDLPFVAVRSSATAEDLPSISKNEYILIKINNGVYYRTIEEIYELVGEGEGYEIEIPAIKEHKIQWCKVSNLYKHKVKNEERLYEIITETGRKIIVSPTHTLLVLDEDNLTIKEVKNIKELKGDEKLPAINQLPLLNLNNASVDVLDYISGEDIVEENGFLMIKNNSTNWKIQSKLLRNLRIKKDFAYFLGVYCAEGSIYSVNEISITNSDKNIMNRIIRYTKELGLYNEQKINKNSLRIYNKTLLRFLNSVAGEPIRWCLVKERYVELKKFQNLYLVGMKV